MPKNENAAGSPIMNSAVSTPNRTIADSHQIIRCRHFLSYIPEREKVEGRGDGTDSCAGHLRDFASREQPAQELDCEQGKKDRDRGRLAPPRAGGGGCP